MDIDQILAAGLDHVGDPVVVTDLSGDITHVNPRFSEVTGWPVHDVLGKNPRLFRSGDTPSGIYVELWGCITSGHIWRGTLRNKRRDGTKYWADITIVPVRDETGPVRYVGIEGGQTERRLAERRRMVRRAASLSCLDGGTEAQIVRGVLQDICEAMRWRFGAYWTPHGTRLRCAAFWSSDEGALREFERITDEIEFEPGVGLPGRVWSSGVPAWIEDVTRDANFPRAPVAKNVGLGAAFAFPIMVERDFHGVLEFFNDSIERPDEELLEMMADAGRQMALWRARRESERKEELRHSHRLAAVGQLAAGMAHELNNPLGIILGFAQVAGRLVAAGHELALPLRSIERESLRCRDLVAKLLAFSRRQSEKPMVPIEVNAVVKEALGLIEGRARLQAVLIVPELAFPGPILGDSPELEQALVNLCNNALDAMPGGGTLTVRTSFAERPGGPRVLLEVADTGTGIPTEVQARVFEPFFTTKEVGKGTGLGLALVHGTVERHGGRILLRSEVGRGTTFTIEFPGVPAGPLDEGA